MFPWDPCIAREGARAKTYTSNTTVPLILLDAPTPGRESNHGHTSCPTIAYMCHSLAQSWWIDTIEGSVSTCSSLITTSLVVFLDSHHRPCRARTATDDDVASSTCWHTYRKLKKEGLNPYFVVCVPQIDPIIGLFTSPLLYPQLSVGACHNLHMSCGRRWRHWHKHNTRFDNLYPYIIVLSPPKISCANIFKVH